MALSIEATFENGVFVPVTRPDLVNHERVRLTVEQIAPAQRSSRQIIQDRRKRRIQVAPDLAREIASSPEFLPEEG